MNARRATAHLLTNVGRENRIWVSWPLLPTSILPMLENSPSWVSRDTIFSGHWGGRGVPNGRAKGNLRYLSEDHGWRRGGNMDPLTRALQVAGAVPAEPYTSRILGVLPGRTGQTTGRHVWRPGGRLGKDADGSLVLGAACLDATPLAVRKASARELREALRAKGRAGCPPAVSTDTQKGYSGAAYQSHDIPFDSCGGDGSILVRLEGTCALARPGTKNDSARRAKVRYCYCCSRANHIAAPSRYILEEVSNEDARGSMLRGASGPWAAREYAA